MSKWEAWGTIINEPPTKINAESGTKFNFPMAVCAPLLASFIILIVLIVIRPPFVCTSAQTKFESDTLSWNKLVGWTLLSTVIMYIGPSVETHFKSN